MIFICFDKLTIPQTSTTTCRALHQRMEYLKWGQTQKKLKTNLKRKQLFKAPYSYISTYYSQ